MLEAHVWIAPRLLRCLFTMYNPAFLGSAFEYLSDEWTAAAQGMSARQPLLFRETDRTANLKVEDLHA
jgi:hypothetical protein